MTCQYCEELVDEPQPATVQTSDGPAAIHRECFIRMIAGSAAHQLGECSCSGGTREDPPGVSLREAAKLAYDTYLTLHGGSGAE